jgi:amino acid transporter
VDFVGLLLGHRLANREAGKRKIGAFAGVPAMGLDALGSLAYGPEAALAVLAVAGLPALVPAAWLMLPIILLLALLFASYWQTIRAYPGNGGAYAVARRNLGSHASLLAATALMIDYVLNVAVGISAGVGALISAVPSLHPYTLPLCLCILAVLTAVNLRGTPESGRAWALPTYLYIVCFIAIIATGLFRAAMSVGHPHPLVTPAPLLAASQPVTIWLLLRAFASGCTAMTGVEAVSNSMSAFREPIVRRAHATLSVIVGVLGLLLAGLSWLIPAYHIGAMDQSRAGYRSVLAQLAGAVVGHGAFYFISMAALLCVLTLSANTSFVAFPRLCRNVARDGYLPQAFAQAGRRLVYSIGLLFLAVSAGLLLVLFDGVTDRLIPLFAIGAFLGFTLSQIAMTVHWRRALHKGHGHHGARRLRFAINAVGALVTAVTLLVIVVAKFTEGAWITVLAVPSVVLMLLRIHAYYQHVDRHTAGLTRLGSFAIMPPAVLVVAEEWDRPTMKALDFGLGISSEVTALHLVRLGGPGPDEHLDDLRRRWHEYVEAPALSAGLPMPRLRIMEATYRRLDEPVFQAVRELEAKYPRRRIAVLVPELVKQHWYQILLHTHRARRLRKRLLACGDTCITVVSVPWYLEPGGPLEKRFVEM